MSLTTDSQGAADLLYIHPQTVESLARKGELPGCKPGNRWVFVVSDLVTWLQSRAAAEQSARAGESTPVKPARNPKPPLPNRRK